MPHLNVENFYDADSSDNEENHSKLLNSILQLDSTQKIKPAEKKEITSEVSEYNLSSTSVKKNLVSVKELAQTLGQKSGHEVISKKIKKVTQKSKVLPKPLEKPVEEKLKRSIGFENVKKQLQRWNAVVARNALKDQIIFPLNDSSTQMHKSNEFLSQFRTPTNLEKEIAKVLKQENVEEKNAEEINEFPLTLEEMMEKRKEMAQLRAKLSYKQTKAQRQNKIKSKKYHRLLKREKLKQQLKEFDMLQKTDPEAALKKLSELDKTRAKERATLRHRNTGQWAKNLTVRAKYDVETRKILAEQLKISRELTQKVSKLDSSDDEEPSDPVVLNNTVPVQDTFKFTSDNPWVINVSQEVQDFVSGYKKFWGEKEKETQDVPNEKEKKTQDVPNEKEKETQDVPNEKEKETQDVPNEKEKERSKINQNTLMKGERRAGNNGNKSTEVKKESGDNNSKRNIKLIEKDEVLKGDEELQKPLRIKALSVVNFNKKSKVSSKKFKEYVTVHPTSGVWKVTPITNEIDSQNRKKRKVDDIDTLFDDLNDKLMKKATKKVKKMKKKLKKFKNMKKMLKEPSGLNTEFDLSLKNKNVVERPDLDVGLLEGTFEDQNLELDSVNNAMNNCNNKLEPAIIDPKKFIQLKPKKLRTHLPDNTEGEEEGLDDEKAQQMYIEEAFGEDDVMAEFKEMKEEEEKNNKVEIEAALPGWGEWGGTGIKPKPRKKRLLILNHPPRKDKLKKDVIINENENPNLKSHLVKEVPHPFKSVDAFEANIRAPVGRDWVPETAHQKLIQKQVVTKLGTIIEPMNEDEIVRLKKASKSPYQGLKKEKM